MIDCDADFIEIEACAVEFKDFEKHRAQVVFCSDMACCYFGMSLQETYYHTDLPVLER